MAQKMRISNRLGSQRMQLFHSLFSSRTWYSYKIPTLCCIACFICAVMALSSCGDGRTNHNKRQNKSNKAQFITTTLSSVTEFQGETLIELAVGSRVGVSNGSFFRVYGSGENKNLIKATIKVDEVIDTNRSLARLVGDLLDRNQPLIVGDRAREIRDLGTLIDAADIEDDARKTTEAQTQIEETEQEEYQKLRENFQRELKKITDLHNQDMVSLQERHAREVTRISDYHNSQLKQKDLERMADLAALQATLKRDGQKLLKSQKNNNDEKNKNLQNERNTLDGQIQSLLVQQTTLQNRIRSLVEEIADNTNAHKTIIHAEVESREVLEARIRNLERELSGENGANEVVLSNDPHRNETILEKLARITEERNASINSAKLLRTHIEGLDSQIAKHNEKIRMLQDDFDALQGDSKNQRLSLTRMRRLEKELTDSKEHLSAASLARLEAERALYDLAIRVMRVPEKNPESLNHLKEKLRSQYNRPAE